MSSNTETSTSTQDTDPILQRILPHLVRSDEDDRPIVMMTCGIAGSGKSTLAESVVKTLPSFNRVSIDAIVAARHGIWGKDYPPEKYAEYQDEADGIYLETFQDLLKDTKNDIVLDRSFYAAEDREEFADLIAKGGARKVLVYLKRSKEFLWNRVCSRRENGINADSALLIDEKLLDSYVAGFEAPSGEGEIVIDIG